jgi:glucose-6-phosphate 1-dehydrogenase
MDKIAPSCTVVIMGASGDLTHRKLVPALHSLACEGLLNPSTRIIGVVFEYGRHHGELALPDAYERLLLDAMQGDASLFARSDEIDLSWSLADPLIQPVPPAFYQAGGAGPDEADLLLAYGGCHWLPFGYSHGSAGSDSRASATPTLPRAPSSCVILTGRS